jgi:hypothetical protein
MKAAMSVISSVFGGFILALIVASISVLVLVFSTPDVDVRREGLWGAVFFQSITAENGTVSVGVGIASWWPLAILTLVLAALIWLVVHVFGRLKRYKRRLELEEEPVPRAGEPRTSTEV